MRKQMTQWFSSSVTIKLVQDYESLQSSNSDIPRTINEDSTVTFNLGSTKLALLDLHAITAYVSGGRENRGFWVELTSLEQDMIISGFGVSLSAAICAILGVSWVACTVIEAIITGVTVVLSHHKKCNGRVKVHYIWIRQLRGSQRV
ncbi:hypothetical protein UL82_10620 [Corynebacterium kutscheri]|uniref:Uncharacterized protein n=1 Tax=Corynebacterium kutscheri TaxID=35755 RepID=A0A0F6R3E7_9CORY|nr:hypothetical protein UL82_10620 [Corynebacterium kutscheri]VEH10602.1 Uncharacterised protein [Corynebacterium kutscheri]